MRMPGRMKMMAGLEESAELLVWALDSITSSLNNSIPLTLLDKNVGFKLKRSEFLLTSDITCFLCLQEEKSWLEIGMFYAK